MRIFVTGCLGYIGSALGIVQQPDEEMALAGIDTGFFAGEIFDRRRLNDSAYSVIHTKDIREPMAELLKDVDAIIHLAAISNDPMGSRFEAATRDINLNATCALAEQAKKAGVRNFVFASSCSVYGASGEAARREDDALAPLTAYARSKVAAETALTQLADGGFTVTCLRFATACGMSPRLRLDLVLNDFVFEAVMNGEIKILSDGTPWRPLIDADDMARLCLWAVARPQVKGGAALIVNAGNNANNFQVRELAEAVARQVPGSRVSVNKDAAPDKRSYQVNFDMLASLIPDFRFTPLTQTIAELIEAVGRHKAESGSADKATFSRLATLNRHLAAARLSPDLRWITA